MHLNIKELMKKNNMNKNQLSKETKISYQNICKMYNGETSRIYLDSIESLCIALKCTPNDLFSFDK